MVYLFSISLETIRQVALQTLPKRRFTSQPHHLSYEAYHIFNTRLDLVYRNVIKKENRKYTLHEVNGGFAFRALSKGPRKSWMIYGSGPC